MTRTMGTLMRMGTRMAGIPTDRQWRTGEHSEPVAMHLRQGSRRDAVIGAPRACCRPVIQAV